MLVYEIPKLEQWVKGTYSIKVLEQTEIMRVEVAFFDVGIRTWVHQHPHAEEFYYIIKGELIGRQPRTVIRTAKYLSKPELQTEGQSWATSYDVEEKTAKAGTALLFPPNKLHQVESKTRVVMLRVLASAKGDFSSTHFRDWPPNTKIESS